MHKEYRQRWLQIMISLASLLSPGVDDKASAAETDAKAGAASEDTSSVGALEVRITAPSGEPKSETSSTGGGASAGAAARKPHLTRS